MRSGLRGTTATAWTADAPARRARGRHAPRCTTPRRTSAAAPHHHLLPPAVLAVPRRAIPAAGILGLVTSDPAPPRHSHRFPCKRTLPLNDSGHTQLHDLLTSVDRRAVRSDSSGSSACSTRPRRHNKPLRTASTRPGTPRKTEPFLRERSSSTSALVGPSSPALGLVVVDHLRRTRRRYETAAIIFRSPLDCSTRARGGPARNRRQVRCHHVGFGRTLYVRGRRGPRGVTSGPWTTDMVGLIMTGRGGV